MKTLVYKRTHNGDPSLQGIFGCNNCMRKVRSWDYEAVIGVGGQGKKAAKFNLSQKLTWIGIGPHKTIVPDKKHPIVTFDHFLYFGPEGKLLRDLAPHLADLMYVRRARNVMTFDADQQADVDKLLALAATAPPSLALAGESQTEAICKPRASSSC